MTAMAPIAEVCEVNPRLRKKLAANDMVAFVGMSGLDATSAIATDSEQRPYADVAKAYTSFEHGDVLVAKITPCFENGKIARPVKNLRVTQSITEALSDTQMVGRERLLEDGVLAPALKLGKFRFSSATEF